MAPAANPDLLVLVGPVFRPEMEKIWAESLDKLVDNGTRLVLLGVAAMRYDRDSVRRYRRFLNRYRPYILVSRDSDTYELLGDLAENAYNGIDLGFFLPEVYQPHGLKGVSPYVILNFDKVPEPSISIFPSTAEISRRKSHLDAEFHFDNDMYIVRFPRLRTKFTSNSRYAMFLEGALFHGSEIVQLGERSIVRTDHRPHPMLRRKTYRSPNTMVNDTPYPYLELYSGSDLTLSNRMHACVAALAFGKPAMLFSSSPRLRLLERLNLERITTEPVTIDNLYLQEEKDKLCLFLKDVLEE